MTQTVEDPRLATGGWLDLTRQAFHLLDYSPLSGRTIPSCIFGQFCKLEFGTCFINFSPLADKTNGDFLFFKAIPENWFRKRYHHEKPASSKWTPYIPNYHLHQIHSCVPRYITTVVHPYPYLKSGQSHS